MLEHGGGEAGALSEGRVPRLQLQQLPLGAHYGQLLRGEGGQEWDGGRRADGGGQRVAEGARQAGHGVGEVRHGRRHLLHHSQTRTMRCLVTGGRLVCD